VFFVGRFFIKLSLNAFSKVSLALILYSTTFPIYRTRLKPVLKSLEKKLFPFFLLSVIADFGDFEAA
jgi:hypothetical protein